MAGRSQLPVVVVSGDDFMWFVDQALGEMVRIVDSLGDETANLTPALPGANSPYAILTHCLGVMEFWGGSMVAGRVIVRDRDAEFRAHGPVADLIGRVATARARLETDMSALDPLDLPRGRLADPDDADLPFARRQGAVLLHVLEELTQHLGQMQVVRDLLLDRSQG